MIIEVKQSDGGKEFVLVELQGVLETPSRKDPCGLSIGDLTYVAVRLARLALLVCCCERCLPCLMLCDVPLLTRESPSLLSETIA